MEAAIQGQGAHFDDALTRQIGARHEQFALSRVIRFLMLTAGFFLSWYLIHPPNLNLTLSDGLLIIAALTLLMSGRLNSAVFGQLSAIWVVGYFMLVAGFALATLNHGDVLRWMMVAGQYGFAFLLVPMLFNSVQRDLLERTAIAFVLGVALSQLMGVIALQFLSYDDIVPYVGRTFLQGNGRLGAMSAEPNSNGAMCAYALIILVYMMLLHRVRPIHALALGAVIVAGLLASASFTGFTVTVLTVSLLLILTRLSNFLKFGLPIVLLLVTYVGLGGPIPQIFVERVGDALLTMDPSKAGTFTGRSELISEAWRNVDNTLLIGVGPDGYRLISSQGAPVHNLPLLVLNEGGIISFLGIAVLLGCMITAAIFAARNHRIDGAACIAITLAFFIYMLSLPHMYTRIWVAPVLLVFAIALARPRTSSALWFSPQPPPPPNPAERPSENAG